MKEPKLAFPELEDRLKKTRLFAARMAECTVDETRSGFQDDKYKGSCVEDAKEYTIIEDAKEYVKHGIAPNNGTTLLRAVFPPMEISEHYHSHCESLIVEDGLVHFMFGEVDISLDGGSSIKIPANSYHECEFRSETVVLVTVPTEYAKNL